MKNDYNPEKIEKKWQGIWNSKKVFEAQNVSKKPKYYALMEFPYPSGEGLHTGHVRGYTAMDIVSRKRRMEGFNVLFPIGYDAFGLPTENYAIKTGIAPDVVTKKNIKRYGEQFRSVGFSFDWSREINTTDPKYYKWTQWIFLQLLKNGLAYKDKIAINWCPKDKIGLANEEVVGGLCERCGTPVEKREKEQWMLAITKYADRLEKDLDTVDYLEKIKLQQKNWIGRSEGAEIEFKVISQQSLVNSKNADEELKTISVFTTRPDTLFGATYVVLAPEHEFVAELLRNNEYEIKNKEEVRKYIEDTKKKAEIERTADEKEKTGVKLDGVIAINPANGEEIPVFVADYVLAGYGTGAVMAVPAHDERDFQFAKKYELSLVNVISPYSVGKLITHMNRTAELSELETDILNGREVYIGNGWLRNSGKFDGMDSEKGKKAITEFVGGKWVTKFKLRDWVFSRQRYWGEPIPVVHCEKCGIVPLPEKDLPLKLPKVKNYQPTDTGESPLANISKWVNTKCPKCKSKARRETDVMPNWAGSSWYFLAYTARGISNFEFRISNGNTKKRSKAEENIDYWMPVDWYNGGMEHTTLHLLYSRFWNKFLFDIGVVSVSEPYRKRTSHGMILASDGEKMSKSRGNVVNPDSVIKAYGADTLRLYEMFMGPFDQAISWGEENIIGVRRFLEKIWRIQDKIQKGESKKTEGNSIPQYAKFETLLHKTIKKVTDDIENFNFNTAISSMMILTNEMEAVASNQHQVSRGDFEMFLKILSPFAPHICEEIWQKFGHKTLIALEKWPESDPKKMIESEVTIAIQINGKVRSEMVIGPDEEESAVLEKAKNDVVVQKWLQDKKVVKVIYVKKRLLNIVISG